MKYQEWLNGCGCCPDIQDCPPSTGNPCDCDSILLELSKQHTDDLVLQDEIDNLDEKKLDASAYTPDEYATEEWVNEQGFLKTVEPLKTINGESLIGEGDIVISGGSGDAYTKAETDALLDEKVNVVDNVVEEYPFITKKEDTPEGANFNAASYDDAADTFELIITGTTFGAYDVNNCFFVFINESGETTPQINGFYMFNTESYVYPTRIQEYVNLDLYEYHTTDRYNLHVKYSGKNGWRLKQFYIYLLTDYNEGVGYIAYQNYPALQSADAISENVYPALEKLTVNKFDKNFTCNDPLLYEATYKRFRIKTSNQSYNTISDSTSATTNLARAYDVKTYVESKIASGITSVPVYSGSALASVSINNPSGLENGYNRISGNTSVGAGYMVETRNADEAAFGTYNLSNGENLEVFDYNSGSTLFSVGNGHPHNTGGYIRRHNAFEIRQNGDIYYADTNDTEAEYPYEMPMIKLQDVIKNLQNEINTLKAQINGN